MIERFVHRRTLGRLLLALTPALLWADGAAAQVAPVVNANDQSWTAPFSQPPMNQAAPSPAPAWGDSQWGGPRNDSVLQPMAMAEWGNACGCGNDGCGACFPCPPPAVRQRRMKRFDVFGEFLYLRPRNAEVAYAVPIDGPIAPVNGNGIQIGPTAVVDPDYQSAYRFGFNLVGCGCSSITAQWAQFESSSEDSVNIGVPDVIRSLVTHPLGVNAASDGLQSSAQLDIDFDLIDLIIRTPWKRCQQWHTDLLYGVRYGNLRQGFFSSIDVNGSTDVFTEVDFHGVGPQIGINSIHQIGCSGLHLYSRGDASFLVGSFDASYLQQDAFAGEVVNTSWESGRIVPLLEMELGFGYATCGGRFHLRGGYAVNAWFNAVRTDEYIHAVQVNNPDGLGSGITFDGVVVRGEFRF